MSRQCLGSPGGPGCIRSGIWQSGGTIIPPSFGRCCAQVAGREAERAKDGRRYAHTQSDIKCRPLRAWSVRCWATASSICYSWHESGWSAQPHPRALGIPGLAHSVFNCENSTIGLAMPVVPRVCLRYVWQERRPCPIPEGPSKTMVRARLCMALDEDAASSLSLAFKLPISIASGVPSTPVFLHSNGH